MQTLGWMICVHRSDASVTAARYHLLPHNHKKGRRKKEPPTLVAGAWTERQKMYHGGSFLKLADDNMDIQNPEAQNRELSGF